MVSNFGIKKDIVIRLRNQSAKLSLFFMIHEEDAAMKKPSAKVDAQ